MFNHRALISLLFLCSPLLIMLGFNTIDIMVWSFYYEDWLGWFPYVWFMTPTFSLGVWDAYFLFGILPLIAGSTMLGFCIGVLNGKVKGS